MSKKKPSKRKKADPADDIRGACQAIVNDLYAEVERISGPRLESLTQRFNELKSESDATVRECGKIIERLLAVEQRIASMGCQRQPPKTWIGRLHRDRWFCLPWCRWFR